MIRQPFSFSDIFLRFGRFCLDLLPFVMEGNEIFRNTGRLIALYL
jgi:hypothetical protein